MHLLTKVDELSLLLQQTNEGQRERRRKMILSSLRFRFKESTKDTSTKKSDTKWRKIS